MRQHILLENTERRDPDRGRRRYEMAMWERRFRALPHRISASPRLGRSTDECGITGSDWRKGSCVRVWGKVSTVSEPVVGWTLPWVSCHPVHSIHARSYIPKVTSITDSKSAVKIVFVAGFLFFQTLPVFYAGDSEAASKSVRNLLCIESSGSTPKLMRAV